eukprot:CAMPEP_0180659168 /NCGR_PEP_ID=MMETSP1037_2-20121125/57424_1 /TAXON_ID=632150 /ORGANISM="Azadinium spinosum, Strain 3D9" /LENGTH=42 /DNA_ID= /DNA_START= /DNA_END= /DNA_ORIENTATION=
MRRLGSATGAAGATSCGVSARLPPAAATAWSALEATAASAGS